jgi:hypothetical protein
MITLRTSHMMLFSALLLGLSALRASPAPASAPSVVLASDASWDVFSGDPSVPGAVFLGKAQPVCLNPTTPAGCPAGAVLYGNPSTAWTADLASLPGAVWVWAPGVTGATTPADLVQVFFTRTLTLPSIPLSAVLSVGADDAAEVLVNGVPVGATGSVTDPALAAAASAGLVTFDIAPQLVAGDNRIVIQGTNGPASFASCDGGACSYQENPAGVVFGGVIAFDRPPVCEDAFAVPGTAWPPNHKPVTVTVEGVTDPDDDPVAITIDAIHQDEPVAASSCSVVGGIGTDRATVPVERDGSGDGRVYHISFHAADPFGGTCTGDVTLCVPHDQGHGGGCGDGGPLFDSVGACDTGPAGPCTRCDDGDPCTADACTPGGCVHTPLTCDDHVACTTDSCVAGVCQHVPTGDLSCACELGSPTPECDDGDPCTVDACTPAGCAHTPLTCDDDVPCTIDTCVAGVCEHVPASGFDACRCEFEELPMPPPAAACDAGLPDGLATALTNAAQLVGRAPGNDDPRAARPMVRRALRRLAKASRLVRRADHKGVSTDCIGELTSRIRAARVAARAWLAREK